MTNQDELRLDKGDTVLVTGATGLIGSNTADALLSRGYNVRGATRDVGKAQLFKEKIDKLYGPGRVEFVQVDDGSIPDAYTTALQGVAGIIHLAIDMGAVFSPDASVEGAIASATDMTLNLVKSAAKVPSVKAIVVTSSNAAIYNIEWGQDIDVSLNDYNEKSVRDAFAAPKDHPFSAAYIYSAAKARSEQALWKWVADTKVNQGEFPSFSVNTVVPQMNLGRPFNPAPGVYTTYSWLNDLFNGDAKGPAVSFLAPANWFVDVRDDAIIHVAALLDPSTNTQRLWAAGQPPIHINQALQIWRDAFPSYVNTIPADFDFPSKQPLQNIDREASTALLKRYAGRDWIPLRDSLIYNVQGHLNA